MSRSARSGEPVATPMWFGLHNGRAYVRSLADAGKVKRLRRDPHVRVAPCTVRGKPTGPVAEGRGRILSDGESALAERALDAHYGWRRRIYECVGTTTRRADRVSGARPGTQRPALHREDLDGQTEPQPVALDEVQRIAHVGSWSWDTKAEQATCSAETYRIFGRDPRQGPESTDGPVRLRPSG